MRIVSHGLEDPFSSNATMRRALFDFLTHIGCIWIQFVPTVFPRGWSLNLPFNLIWGSTDVQMGRILASMWLKSNKQVLLQPFLFPEVVWRRPFIVYFCSPFGSSIVILSVRPEIHSQLLFPWYLPFFRVKASFLIGGGNFSLIQNEGKLRFVMFWLYKYSLTWLKGSHIST